LDMQRGGDIVCDVQRCSVAQISLQKQTKSLDPSVGRWWLRTAISLSTGAGNSFDRVHILILRLASRRSPKAFL
jgi:hypothetical protein